MNRKEQLETWLIEKPNDPFLRYALATEHISAGEDHTALGIFLKLVEEFPDYYATYYHLGQLQERLGDEDAAIATYKLGMQVCEKLGNKHAFSELKSVLEELEF